MKIRYSNLANGLSTAGFTPCAPLSDTANLALRPTVRHIKLHPTFRYSKPRPVLHCQAQQTSLHAPLLDTQTSLCAPLSVNFQNMKIWKYTFCREFNWGHTVDFYDDDIIMPHCQAQQTSPCTPLSNTAKLAARPTVRYSKPLPVPHCQTQQTLPWPVPQCQA